MAENDENGRDGQSPALSPPAEAGDKPPTKPPAAGRDARRAAALKANLRLRKARP
jgi:hypothetical protein